MGTLMRPLSFPRFRVDQWRGVADFPGPVVSCVAGSRCQLGSMCVPDDRISPITPHFGDIADNGPLSYSRHCTYDALAERGTRHQLHP